jgi:hypothetical protein
MRKTVGLLTALGLSTAIVIGYGNRSLYAENTNDPNAAPNPYRMEDVRVQLPDGRKLGAPIGVEIDHSDGKTRGCSSAAAATPASVRRSIR